MTVPLMIRGFTCSFLPSNFRTVDSQICLVTGAQLCVVDTVHKHHSDQQAEEMNASSTLGSKCYTNHNYFRFGKKKNLLRLKRNELGGSGQSWY